MPRTRSLDEFIMEINKSVKKRNKDNNKKIKSKRVSLVDYLQKDASRKTLRPQQAQPTTIDIFISSRGNLDKKLQDKEMYFEKQEDAMPFVTNKNKYLKRRIVKGFTSLLEDMRRGESWYLGEKDDIVEAVQGYLIEVRYDGQSRKAVLYVYDPSRKRLVRWYDRSGHTPYFLVMPGFKGGTKNVIEKISEFFEMIGGKDQIIAYHILKKFHPIQRRWVNLVRVRVKDPLVVKNLRDNIDKLKKEDKKNNLENMNKKKINIDIDYFEADIRYHNNYVYDKRLIPGMIIQANRNPILARYEPDKEALERVLRAFSDEPEDIKKRAISWIPLFEQEPPMPSMVAVDIEVYTPYEGELPDPERAPYPVVSVALVSNTGEKKVFLLERPDVDTGDLSRINAEVRLFKDEISLILEVFREIDKYSIVVTFNGDNFDIPYLYNRLIVLGIPQWVLPVEFHQDMATFRNQLHIDLYKFFDIRALQVYAFGNKYREKNLDSIAEALLGKRKVALEKPISELDIATLAEYNLTDAQLTMELMTFGNNLVWNLIILLMRISKLGLEDVTRSQVSAWIRSLLHWEHRARNWLILKKQDISGNATEARSKAIIKDKKYKGAIVLKPPQGVFFNIIVLDFASLYPSVIKNWNLSYETVNNPACTGEKRIVPEVGHEVCMSIKGLTSEIVGLLRDFRVKIYKKKAKDKSLPETARLWFNTVQSAMKVYINASYGVFGNSSFSFYSLAVAESVTAIGRAVLKDTLRQARKLGLMILYGDTDSIFIWDPPKEKLEDIIRYVKEKHNLELEVDKVFKIALFSGLKKNYIGVSPDGKIVIKGMVGKKSNTPEFLKNEFAEATKVIARVNDPEELLNAIDDLRKHIENILRKLRRREYMLDELAIKIMLSKDPKEYTKNTPQHVKAAKLLKKYGLRVTKGTVVTFVKTKDKLGVRPVKLARLTDVDVNKYQELVRTVFEQMLLSLGMSWNRLLGQRNLLFLNAVETG